MPSTLNGIGVELVRVSKRRNVMGQIQYDAVEAFVVLFCPLIPYSVLHVLSVSDVGLAEKASQSVPLRFSGRLVAKAFLNGWGNGLMFLGGAVGAIMSYVFATVERPFDDSDRMFLTVLWSLFVLGIVLKLSYIAINKSDERIKDIIGVHKQGTSDPYHWYDEAIQSATESIRTSQGQRLLIEIAEESFRENDTATAMYITRIGMRSEPSPRFLDLLERLKARNRG